VKDVPGNIRVGTRHCWSPTGAPSKVLTTGEGDGNGIKLWCDLQHPKQPWSRQLRILRADPNLPFVGLASSWFWDMSADMRTKIIHNESHLHHIVQWRCQGIGWHHAETHAIFAQWWPSQ
jgi:hypothetical protein